MSKVSDAKLGVMCPGKQLHEQNQKTTSPEELEHLHSQLKASQHGYD